MPKWKPPPLTPRDKSNITKKTTDPRYGTLPAKLSPEGHALNNFHEHVDRESFLDAILSHPDNNKEEVAHSKWRKLAAMIQNPEYDTIRDEQTKLTFLARKAGLEWKAVAEYFADFQRSKGMVAMMNHMPRAMEETALDSLDKMVRCGECEGSGWAIRESSNGNKVRVQCPECEGAGKIQVTGNKDSKKMMFEMGGVLGKERGPLININQQFGSTSLEENVIDIGKLLEEP